MGLNIKAAKEAIAKRYVGSISVSYFQHPELLEIALTHPNHIYDGTNIIRPQQKKKSIRASRFSQFS
ncbi:MAG: hypothetical protein F6K24_37070 [Okeania sp. SIO2D1]|nr:hypothetical protein [Okeania sp. SIO2D1]